MDKKTEHINAFKVSKSTKESIIKIAEDEELLIHNVIRKLIRIGLKNYHIVDTNEMVEISDEEIEQAAIEEYYYDELVNGEFKGMIVSALRGGFEEGAKWYREQLK
jgi:chaperonin GroEL (HSP60 family)